MNPRSVVAGLALVLLCAIAGTGTARAAGAPLDGLHATWSDALAVPRLGVDGPIVAIIDSGADLHHPSLREHLWTNAGEVPGNGIDDDRNGYADDVNGANIVAPRSTPDAGADSWHGTAVAGLLAAGAADGTGPSGAAPGARLMIVRVIGADGHGDTTQLADGIDYAVRNGAAVINCSLTTGADYPIVEDAIERAAEAGVPVVAAAGNDGRSLDVDPVYPAASTSPAVISVAAMTAGGRLADFSNFGRGSVDVAAPGVDIDTTYPEASFIALSGTSAAAPLVSATLALERAVRPQATLSELRNAVLTTADRTGLPVSAGVLDAQAAVNSLTQAPERATTDSTLVRRQSRGLVLTRWRLARSLSAPVQAVLRVRAGTASARILSSRRLVLRGGRGTIATPAARTAGRLWIELETAATAQRPGYRVGGLASTR